MIDQFRLLDVQRWELLRHAHLLDTWLLWPLDFQAQSEPCVLWRAVLSAARNAEDATHYTAMVPSHSVSGFRVRTLGSRLRMTGD